MDPAFDPQDLDRLINDFTERIPEVVDALVVSSDGVPVVAPGRMPPDHLEKLSAITSGLIALARGAVEISDGGAFTQALVTMERGTLVIMAINDGANLAVLTTDAADLDQVAYDMTILVEQAASVFASSVRDPVIPGPDPGRGERADQEHPGSGHGDDG